MSHRPAGESRSVGGIQCIGPPALKLFEAVTENTFGCNVDTSLANGTTSAPGQTDNPSAALSDNKGSFQREMRRRIFYSSHAEATSPESEECPGARVHG